MQTVVFIIIAVFLYTCSGSLELLQQKHLEKLNTQTSKDILEDVIKSVGKTVAEQKILITECETKINTTIKSCTDCSTNLCQPKPQTHPAQIFVGLVKEVTKPLTDATKIIVGVGSNLKVIPNVGIQFYNTLSGVTNTLKNTLIGGGEEVFSDAISGLESVGKNVVKETENAIKNLGKFGVNVGSHVGGVFKTIGGGVNVVGKEIGNFGKQVGNHFENFGKDVVNTGKKIGDGIVDAGKSVGNVFKSIFGKRSTRHIMHKRCAESCPQCDLLDAQKKTQDKIIEGICGVNFLSNQKTVLASLKTLEDLENFILAKNPVVTKVEYETSSMSFENGSVLFKTAFVTYHNGNKIERFQFSGNFDIADIEAMSIKVSEQVRSRLF